MGAPHPGHGNVVEPVSSKGTPDDVQFVALSLIMDPQEHFAHALPFFMVACSITSNSACQPANCTGGFRTTEYDLTIEDSQCTIHARADDQFTVSATAPAMSQADDVSDSDALCLFTPKNDPNDTRFIPPTSSSNRARVPFGSNLTNRIDPKNNQLNSVYGRIVAQIIAQLARRSWVFLLLVCRW